MTIVGDLQLMVIMRTFPCDPLDGNEVNEMTKWYLMRKQRMQFDGYDVVFVDVAAVAIETFFPDLQDTYVDCVPRCRVVA